MERRGCEGEKKRSRKEEGGGEDDGEVRRRTSMIAVFSFNGVLSRPKKYDSERGA
jgi:hypothetical protein